MKPSFSLRIVFAVLMALTLSSCASLQTQLKASAKTKGSAEASVDIGALPLACRTPVAHAPLVVGQGAVGTLKRERAQLDKANGVIGDCAALQAAVDGSLKRYAA